MSYAAPYWAMPHPKWATVRGTLKNIIFPAHRSFADPYDKMQEALWKLIFIMLGITINNYKSIQTLTL